MKTTKSKPAPANTSPSWISPLRAAAATLAPPPLEYLFISLAGCVVTIGTIIAKQRHLPVRKIEAHVEGELDTDVLMGKSTDVRAGFSSVRVVAKIDADMTQQEKEAFLHEIDTRCPISDNVFNTTPIELIAE